MKRIQIIFDHDCDNIIEVNCDHEIIEFISCSKKKILRLW